MDELLLFLQEILPQVDFSTKDKLISQNVLDSIAFVVLVSGVSDNYDLNIPVEDLSPENFDSVESIWALINRLRSIEYAELQY